MSTVGASNGNNPYVQAQTLWKRGQSQSTAARGDAPSQSFATTGPQNSNTSSATAATPPSVKTTSTSAGTFPRFEPQTLQTLLAVQAATNK